MSGPLDLDRHLAVAYDAAAAGGAVLRELHGRIVRSVMKSSYDIQAEADLRTEEAIRKTLVKAFPGYGIVFEGGSEKPSGRGCCWLVDPLDGTLNLSRGIDEFCISIALWEDSQTQVGVIHEPLRRSFYHAVHGGGAFAGKQRLSVSTEPSLRSALIATDCSSKVERRRQTFAALRRMADQVRHVRILGSAALHMARIAAGRIDGYFKHRANISDYAAGALLVSEAGGKVSDLDGSPFGASAEGIVASNGRLHRELLGYVVER